MVAAEGGAYRWWENYLVRYLMPSIAGAVVVSLLVSVAGQPFRALLLLDIGNDGLQAPTLVLLFLYGNLFCYVASFPILVFHVTRVIDFKDGVWAKDWMHDGYLMSVLVGFVAFVIPLVLNQSFLLRTLPFALVLIFVLGQVCRIRKAGELVRAKGLGEDASRLFVYAYALARRRGVLEETTIHRQQTKETDGNDDEEGIDQETHRRTAWRRELIDSYRHMREHGNSAFIFFLELVLAANCYSVLAGQSGSSQHEKLVSLGALFALWALPALGIHLVGQQIERRFSLYDRRLD